MSEYGGNLEPAKSASAPSAAGTDHPGLVAVFRGLQELAIRARGDLGEQIRGVLELGSRELDLPNARFLRVRGSGASVLEAFGPDLAENRDSFPVADAYCGSVLQSDRPAFFPDPAGISGPTTWPSEARERFEAYIGATVRVAGRPYGVLSFASRTARPSGFSSGEQEIVTALARHLEGLIGGQEQLNQAIVALNEVSAASGPEFFRQLAHKAAELLDTPYAMVCERVDESRVRSHAYSRNGEILDNIEYDLEGTPCRLVIDEGFHHCPDDIQGRFPDARYLVEMDARSYLGVAIRDGEGNVIGQIATVHTEPRRRSLRRDGLIRVLGARATAGFARIRAERQRDQQRELVGLLSDSGHVGIFHMDLVGQRLILNDSLRERLGFAKAEDYREAWTAAVHPADRSTIDDAVEAHLEDRTDAYTVEYRVNLADEETLWFLARGRAIRDDADQPTRLVGAIFDITDQKKVEEERQRLETKVQQSQRLESLGVLAGGLAHDFNNLLMGVLGNAGLARRAVQRGSLVDQKIAEIETAAQRAAELTNQMLAYSGRARFTADSFDLNRLVEEMARLLRTVVSKKAALSLQLATEELPIEADASQVRQVVMNLITNASDALADQPGAVTMATGLRHFDRHFLSEVVPDADLTEGQYAFLEVADTGVGMDENTRGRVFDPFFTTKFTGRGLGMAAVLGIMRSHGGGIRVQSSPGEGTRVAVLFPPAEADEKMLEDGPEVDDDTWEGQGAVLVVDDEEMVRNLMTTVLEDAGFEVLTANDGVEALEVFEENADKIRLILLDMMMPRMNGEEVYTEIRSKSPGTSIILMSGFSEEQVTRGISDAEAKFLKKPFQISALLNTVQDVLDS